MKIARVLIIGCALALALPAVSADPYSIIKQRARNVANPQPPPQPTPQPAPVRPAQPITPMAHPLVPAPTNVTPAVALTAEQEAALKQVVADLNAIKAGAKPTAAQTAKVQASLAALSNGNSKPSADEISRLANGLTAAWGAQKMTAIEQLRFAKELLRILNHTSLPAGEAEAAVNGARTLLKYSGMNEGAADHIVATLTSIISAAHP